MSYNFTFNSLNAELNPICHLLALLGAHHILHISRIRVNTNLIISDIHAMTLICITILPFMFDNLKSSTFVTA